MDFWLQTADRTSVRSSHTVFECEIGKFRRVFWLHFTILILFEQSNYTRKLLNTSQQQTLRIYRSLQDIYITGKHAQMAWYH